jgi:hypothetical protein
MANIGNVVCTSRHDIDLDTGLSLAPGESAEDVDLDHPHNRALVIDGSLAVTEGSVPRVRHEEQLEQLAAEPKDDGETN